jgi:hypothetical protein
MFYACIQKPEKDKILAAEMKSITDVLLVKAVTR